MNQSLATPQDAEDAYYDALEAGDLDAVMAVWENSDDIACLLPMQTLARGRDAVRKLFEPLLGGGHGVMLAVTHLQWIETPDLAVHLLEETATPPPGRPVMPIYATNVYRRGADGWYLLSHQNAPAAPPAGMKPHAGGPG